MKKIIVFLFAFVMLLLSYNYKKEDIKEHINENIIDEKNAKEVKKKVDINYNDKIQSINFEDYVIGVVACEMPASFNMEALKAMAVAARTFALYKITTNKNYVLSTTTKDQCYISKSKMKKNWKNEYNKNYNKILNAVKSTNNEYMTYNNKVIISFYFSISNGYTENCENVFTQKLHYLRSVDSSWDKEYSYKEKTVKMSVKEFLKKLDLKTDKIENIKINRSKTGRIKNIIVNNNKYKGTVFRKLLSLRSTDFDLRIKEDNILITTRGYGHGVGMSQYGANAMANHGYKYDEILKYYYTDIEITNNI